MRRCLLLALVWLWPALIRAESTPPPIVPAADRFMALATALMERPTGKPERVNLSAHLTLGRGLLRSARQMTEWAASAKQAGSRRTAEIGQRAVERWQKLLPECATLAALCRAHCTGEERAQLDRLQQETETQVRAILAALAADRAASAPPEKAET